MPLRLDPVRRARLQNHAWRAIFAILHEAVRFRRQRRCELSQNPFRITSVRLGPRSASSTCLSLDVFPQCAIDTCLVALTRRRVALEPGNRSLEDAMMEKSMVVTPQPEATEAGETF